MERNTSLSDDLPNGKVSTLLVKLMTEHTHLPGHPSRQLLPVLAGKSGTVQVEGRLVELSEQFDLFHLPCAVEAIQCPTFGQCDSEQIVIPVILERLYK